MTTIEFLFSVCIIALIVLTSLALVQQRQILDALHTLIAQGAKRRGWKRNDG